MKIYRNPLEDEWQALLERPAFDTSNLYDSVEEIIKDVRENGDAAIKEYTKKFDGVEVNELEVSQLAISASKYEVNESLQAAIRDAKRNIKTFHAGQLCKNNIVETTPGVKCWQKTVPIEKVGLYIPGGSAPLLSTVLMLGVPAKLAGCKEIVLCSPPGEDGKINPAILFVADLLGITKVYRVGGVQAIAAMAYGTETIPAVNKIFGPGNQYVTAAKQLVSRDAVAIDMPAGPSELAIIADDSAKSSYVASDLLSQAEHGGDSQVVLITTSEKLIKKVLKRLEEQLAMLPRKAIAAEALLNSKTILLGSTEEMIRMANMYAPEHLIITCENYGAVGDRIVNAGSIFLGNFSPESAGDYASGTNHTLPTNGWAHAYSGLNMDAFVKKITYQEISKYGLFNLSNTVMLMAEAEELEAHRNAVAIRLNKAKGLL